MSLNIPSLSALCKTLRNFRLHVGRPPWLLVGIETHADKRFDVGAEAVIVRSDAPRFDRRQAFIDVLQPAIRD